MKATKNIALFLLLVIICQSCSLYHKTSVSINEAYETGDVKVISTDGGKKEYDNIIIKDSVYYGIIGENELRLDPDQISSIYLKNYKKSNFYVISLTIVIALLALWLTSELAKIGYGQ